MPEGFALMLETACEDFEILQLLISQKTRVVSDTGDNNHRSAARIQMALAKSFVSHVIRARRICEKGAATLSISGDERKLFLKNTSGTLKVRDVIEHGFDPGNGPRGKKSVPTLHHHTDIHAIVDETALVILGTQKILMGAINLYDVFVSTDRMRKLAGFRSLK